MANLPPKLVDDILLVSPVKSLLRFKCVSKSFYATISSQDFIYSHLRTSSYKRLHRKLISHIDYNYDNNHTDIHALDINNGSVEEVRLDFEVPFICPLFVASCNGLVLLNTCDNEFSVWNPSTGHYRELPTFPVNFVNSSYYRSRHSGFGYDSTRDDYKILQIICINLMSYEVWIFELRSSRWRKVQDFPYSEYTDIRRARVGKCFANGYVYFLCYKERRDKSHIIVAFDVAKETFSVVLEPKYENEGKDMCLEAFDGCLSVAVHNENTVDLYVRKKERLEFTWTKLFSVIQLYEHEFSLRTLGYSTEGDKFLFFSRGNVYSYDFKERRLQKIETSLSLMDLMDYILCVENLVSICS